MAVITLLLWATQPSFPFALALPGRVAVAD